MKKFAVGTRGEGEKEREEDGRSAKDVLVAQEGDPSADSTRRSEGVGDAPRQEEAPEKEAITLLAEREENRAEGDKWKEEERREPEVQGKGGWNTEESAAGGREDGSRTTEPNPWERRRRIGAVWNRTRHCKGRSSERQSDQREGSWTREEVILIDYLGELQMDWSSLESYETLQGALIRGTIRPKRRLLDAGGSDLNWLFGVATDKSLEGLNDHL
ncbi:hypothetical protein OUZ56_017440 [Daphnia magna]|uniref:Uncharacterized protein n=1 Tax=Daphnia magna TaxID=35525 RepID=A0ABR0ASS8_9CRUS|nr:hypothetical protein OUZ56_017440 [Daphnia magna]